MGCELSLCYSILVGVIEGDFVLKEYNNAIGAWMPRTEAVRRYVRDRKGRENTIGKENSSMTLVTNESNHLIDQLNGYKESNLYSGPKAQILKSALLPIITRRYGLLVNTVRFMGRAKESGLDLLKYIESIE